MLFSVMCVRVCSSWGLHASQNHGTPPKVYISCWQLDGRSAPLSGSRVPRPQLPAAAGSVPPRVAGSPLALWPQTLGRSPSYMVGTASRIVVLVRIDVLVQLLVLVPMGSNS